MSSSEHSKLLGGVFDKRYPLTKHQNSSILADFEPDAILPNDTRFMGFKMTETARGVLSIPKRVRVS
jgi:hypothetical protein